ncbi:MAG: class I SAM-dependent methyltransferase [bacterium]|nr:class I SAM-dependent methyltransferase [bacterium]
MKATSCHRDAQRRHRGKRHRARDQHILASSLLWTDSFEPPWGSGEDVLISATGPSELIASTVERLVETAPATRFRLMTNAPVAVEVDTRPLAPSWDPSPFAVREWCAIVFITTDENHPDHRNALHYLAHRSEFRRAFLCESHFALIDVTRHTRTPAVAGRVFKTFFYLEPETWSYLYQSARDLDGPGVALEIGSYVGGSALALAMGCRAGHHPPAVSIDPVLVEAFYANLGDAGCLDHVVPVAASSEKVAADWPRLARQRGLPPGIRLLFVDGDHELEAVRHDLTEWSRHVIAEGEIVVHDYYNAFHPGAARACQGFLREHPEWRVVYRLPEAVVCARS